MIEQEVLMTFKGTIPEFSKTDYGKNENIRTANGPTIHKRGTSQLQVCILQ